MANIPRQMPNEKFVQALQVNIAGALEGILGYETHAMLTNDKRVKKILYHIADD